MTYTKNFQQAKLLEAELKKRKELYTHIDIFIEEDPILFCNYQ